MNIQSSNINFGTRVKMRQVKEISKLTPGASLGSTILGSSSAGTVGSSMSQTVGSGSNVIGTAFSSKASAINSSGIVPSVIEAVTPHATPATVASSQNHPSFIGSLFSTIGDLFHGFGRININTKHPN